MKKPVDVKKKSYNKLLIDQFKWRPSYEEYMTNIQRYSTCIMTLALKLYDTIVSNKPSLCKKIHLIM
jgi:hypothetical protein